MTRRHATCRHAGTLLLIGTLALPSSLQAAPTSKPKAKPAPKASTKTAPATKARPAGKTGPTTKATPKPGAPAGLSAADIADQKAIRTALENFLNAWEKEDVAGFNAVWTAGAQKRGKTEEVARNEFAAYENIRLHDRNIKVLIPEGQGAARECMAQLIFDKTRKEVATGREDSQHWAWMLSLKIENKSWKIDGAYDAAEFYAPELEKETKANLSKHLPKIAPRVLEMLGYYWVEGTNARRREYKTEDAARLIELADAAADALLKKEPKNRALKGWVLSTRGLMASSQSRYEESARFATRALEHFEAVADEEGRASVLSNRANALTNDGRYDEALADFDRSLQITRAATQNQPQYQAIWREKEGSALFNLAGTLDTLGRTEEALARYHEALAIARENNSTYWQSRILAQIGRVLEVAGKTDEALAAFEQGLAAAKAIPDAAASRNQVMPDSSYLSLSLYDAVGDLHLSVGRYEQAQKAYEEAMRLAQSLSFQWRAARLTTKLVNLRHLAGDEELRPELALNLGHTNYIGAVTVSPDGKTWASGGWDGAVKLWDAASGQLLQTLLGHNARIFDIDLSPDGKTLASAGDDSSVKLWTVATGALQRTLIGHDLGALGVAFSPDGTTVASSGRDGKILLWNPQTGSIRRLLQGHVGSARALAYSPDGSILASVGDDKTVRIWDAKTGALVRGLKGHTEPMYALAFSPDGATLASGSDDKSVKLWSPQTGALLKTLPMPARVHAVAFSADGSRLAVAHGAGDQVWDAREGKLLHALQETRGYLTWDIAESPAGPRQGQERFIGGSMDKTLKIWEASTGHLERTLPSQSNYIYWLGFLDDGETLASSLVTDGQARGLMMWDTKTGILRRISLPPVATRGGLGITRDHRKIIVLDEKTYALRIHDAATGKLLWTGQHDKTINNVNYTNDLKLLASTSSDQTLKLWDMETGKLLHTLRSSTPFIDANISPDGRRAVFIGKDGTFEVKEVAGGKVVFTVRPPAVEGEAKTTAANSGMQPQNMSYLPDGRKLLSLNPLRLWDASTGKLLQTFGTVPVATVAATQDGALLASSNADRADNTIQVWDAATGKLKWTLSDHTGHVEKLGFSPDGKRLASTGFDNTIKIWSTATGRLLATMVPVPDEASGEIVKATAPNALEGSMAWLTVTPDGYYTCSEGADYAINWRFGNRLVPFSDFEETFRRREMVRQSLAEATVEGKPVLTYARVAPSLRFLSPSAHDTVSGASLRVEVEATDDADVQDIQFFTNGSNVPEAAAKVLPSASKAISLSDKAIALGDKAVPVNHTVSRTFSAELPLPPGETEVLVRAVVYDKDRNSAQSTLRVLRGDVKPALGDLHALCIGVSQYRNPRYNLQFAAADANALSEALKAQSGKNYANVQVTVLTDEQASPESIRAAIADLKQNAKPADTILIFLSGHGVPLGGEFYFAPFGVVADDIEGTAVPWRDILDPLKDIVGKKIVLADACHSGARVADEAATGEQILDASRRHKGIVVLASSSGDRYSYEIEELKHGAFTVALLEALDGKADNMNADGKLTLPELESYLSERTNILTEGRQQPHLVAQDFNPQTSLALTR